MEKPTIYASAPKPPKQIRIEEVPVENKTELQELPEKKEELPEETKPSSTITVMHPTVSKDAVVRLPKEKQTDNDESSVNKTPKIDNSETAEQPTGSVDTAPEIAVDAEQLPDPEKESTEEQLEVEDIKETENSTEEPKTDELVTETPDPEKESTEEQLELANDEEAENIAAAPKIKAEEISDLENTPAETEDEIANIDAASNNDVAIETKENEGDNAVKESDVIESETTIEALDTSLPTEIADDKTATTITEPKNETEKSLKPAKQKVEVEGFENLKIPGDDELFQRQYYTMGEVATMFHANQSQIRFWENEFDIIQPKKNKKGDRYFRPEDVKNLQTIHYLLRNRRFTIEGAREYLKSNKQRTQDTVAAITSLEQIKSFLIELKANL